jgi:hypothetical protein
MSKIPDEVAAMCENPQSEGRNWPGSELIRCGRFEIWLGPPIYPGLSVVLKVRGEHGTEAGLLNDARTILRERGRDRANWMLGPCTTPSGLPDVLLELGLSDDIDPVLKGVVLRRPPEGVDPSIEIVRVDRREQLHDFYRVQQEAFGVERAAVDGGAGFVDEMFDAESTVDYITTYLAMIDGEPVATARATFNQHGVVLNGGSTLQRARGRGLYRSLVAARWEDAVARGTPYLTTLARPSSYPILKRMGFEDACEIRVLNDSF